MFPFKTKVKRRAPAHKKTSSWFWLWKVGHRKIHCVPGNLEHMGQLFPLNLARESMERTSCIDWLLLLLGCIQKSIIREKPDPNATIFFPYKSTRSHAHTEKKLKVGVKYQTLQIIGSQKCFSMKAWKWEKGAWPCMRGKEETGRWRAKIKIIYNKAKARKKAFVGIVKCILCWMYSAKIAVGKKKKNSLSVYISFTVG